MRPGDYVTPAQVSLFVGDVWIDDAIRVAFEDQKPMTPLYGYKEREFTNVADGKRIVNGSIIINYKYPSYLYAAVEATGEKRTEIDKTLALAHSLQYASLEERLDVLELARQQGVDDKVDKIFKEAFIDNAPGAASEQVLPDVLDYGPKSNIEIRVFFDSPQRSSYYKALMDVHFIGEATTVNNAVRGALSASGRPIYEIYSFFARRVENRRLTTKDSERVNAGRSTSIKEIFESLLPTDPKTGST